jgi:hypothetical protein
VIVGPVLACGQSHPKVRTGTEANRLPTGEPSRRNADTAYSSVNLFWIPLGAGGHSVRFNGRVFEAVAAAREHRPRCDLFHAVLVVALDSDRYTIELAPSPNADEASRGVVATGAVGSRWAGSLRLFRYEIRCWRGGSIPDSARPSADPAGSPAILESRAGCFKQPRPFPHPPGDATSSHTGEMWNSNSVTAWLIATAGLPTQHLRPPHPGRAPGWNAGIEVARRNRAPRTDTPTHRSRSLAQERLSMAAGEYVSVSSQRDAEQADLRLEARELFRDPEGELRELAGIYEHRGLPPAPADEVAQTWLRRRAGQFGRTRNAW